MKTILVSPNIFFCKRHFRTKLDCNLQSNETFIIKSKSHPDCNPNTGTHGGCSNTAGQQAAAPSTGCGPTCFLRALAALLRRLLGALAAGAGRGRRLRLRSRRLHRRAERLLLS